MQIIRVRLVNSKNEKGCEKAPVEVLKSLQKIRTNESGKIIEFEKLNLEEIHVDLENLDEANFLIFENSKEIFEKNFKSFFIGGDGCISYSILRAFEKVQENPLLVVFDAHADCLDCNDKFPDNKQWIKSLIENGFSGERIVLVGIRDISIEEKEFLKENGVTLINMDVIQEDIEGVCDLVMERARKSGGFYISIDIDVVEPGNAPGVNDISPGGLSSRELIYFIKRLSFLKNFRGADIVEINPSRDLNGMTVELGAKIFGEMI